MAWWLSWLERRPVTAEVVGSNPIRVAAIIMMAIINNTPSRCGGTGRRTGLKILRDLYSRTGSIPVCGIYLKSLKLYLQSLRLFSCLLQIIFHYVIIRLFKSERLEER